MLSGLGKGLLFRLAAYGLFLLGFWLLFQAFERSSPGLGLAGGAAILAAMWAMVGFKRPPSYRNDRRDRDDEPDADNRNDGWTDLVDNAEPSPGILYSEAARAVSYHRGDALVVSTSSALREWSRVSERRELDLDLTDCMDRAPAVGLGLALAQPKRKVLTLDCDTTLRTNLGGLATIGESQPTNLVHFVFDDATRPSTDGVPIRELDHLDLQTMALSSGYAKAYHFDRLEELLLGLEEAMRQKGPVFVLVSVYREGESPAFPERRMAEGWAEVRAELAEAL